MLFYLTAYALMNVGVFILIAHLAGPGERFTSIDDFIGFGFERPGAAACLAVFMFSLAGIPAMAGFFAKFYVFLRCRSRQPGDRTHRRSHAEQRSFGLLLLAAGSGDVYARGQS